MNIVTGYTGTPHITSDQDRAANQGAIGTGSYILDVGLKMAAQIYNNTEIRIKDGVICHQGCIGVIEADTYDALTIASGTQGMKRTDLIIVRYAKDAETNVESLTPMVVKGTPAASNPATPSYTTGNIQNGDSPVDMPLYKVNINGTTISSVTQMADNVWTQAEADTKIKDTKDSKITFTSSDVADSTTISAWETVAPVASQETHATLLGKISKMLKNLRFIKKQVDSLNGRLTFSEVTATAGSNITIDWQRCRKLDNGLAIVEISFTASANISVNATVISGVPNIGGNQQFVVGATDGGVLTTLALSGGNITTKNAINSGAKVRFIVAYFYVS